MSPTTEPAQAVDGHEGKVPARPSRWPLEPLIWSCAFAALLAWAVYRLELFPLSTTLLMDDGATSLPRAFFTVDHPFHTARAELIRSAWISFDTVRWVASHQGGYPAEFFPFGLPGAAALVSIISFGSISIETAWATTLVVIFLLPGLAYFLLGRQDNLNPGVALIALAGQIAIASDWTHGGFTELVEWGLATNVAGATFALLSIPLLAHVTETRSLRANAASALLISLCAVSNPRSLIAVSIIAIALLIHALITGTWRRDLPPLAIAAALSAGLAAPVIVPLLWYSDFYFFLSYQEYAGVEEYWRATIDAVTWPVLVLAAVGAALAFASRAHRATRVTAVALVLYMGVTAVAAAAPALRELIPQLELPRLMPFQRFGLIYLAAYGTVDVLRRLTPLAGRLATARNLVVAAATSLALILVFATHVGPFAAQEQGLREVPRTEGADGVELVQFRDAISLADSTAPEHTAILVIGSRLSWHEQLWAPMTAEDRRFYYNDWLWYWHQRHDGPYDYRVGHYYPNPSEALSEEYLAKHGIGAVVVTDIADRSTGANVREAARMSDGLEPAGSSGAWDVYTVEDSVTLATLDGQGADSIDVSEDGETITLIFADADPGTVLVRQNWFPRWTAEVNGSRVPVTRTENGYMEIDAGGGDIDVELTYALTPMDAIARVVAMASALVIVAFLVAPRPIRRWARL